MALTATLRSRIETALAGRVPAPFTYRDRKTVETASIGIPELDSLAGGLPRGCLTEICGPSCSGHTSLLLAALASRTAQAEACALVDGRDGFDPDSANAAGVRLENLLWVRCRNIDQSLRATDLLLQGGGFGMVALDLSDTPPETVRYIPLNAWFRFRRIVEDTPTIFLLLDRESNARLCASLVLRLGLNAVRWRATSEDSGKNPFACLLDGFHVGAEVLRSRVKPVTEISVHRGFGGRTTGAEGSLRINGESAFATITAWGHSAGLPPKGEPAWKVSSTE